MDSVKELLNLIARLIINPIIILGFVVSTIYLFYGIVKLIWKADSSSDLKTNKNAVMYGVVGLFIMFSVYGILNIVLKTFGINYSFP